MSDARSVRHLIKGLGPGGAERLVLHQVRAERGTITHHVAYLVAEKSHLVGDLEALDARVTRLAGGGGRWALGLRRLLRDEPTDLVHCHSPMLAAATRLLVRTLPRGQRPVVVSTEHNRWPRHHRLTRTANRLTIRLDAATIAVSADVAATIRGARPDQVRTIEHGIDLDLVRARAARADVRAELGANDDDVVVMCVANLRREKALDQLVEAARRACADAPTLRFALVGQGPLAADVDRWIAEAGLGDRFTALGYRTDVARLLSGADLFTLSSRHEGLPVAIMEALALGLPIVATAAGGVPDAVDDAGLIVSVDDPEALASAYVRLAAAPDERRELGRRAMVRGERFSVTRAIEEIAAVYDAATNASAGGSASGTSAGPRSAS
ncbi:MAG: glycosyltransferase [Actinomycetota bacterium]